VAPQFVSVAAVTPSPAARGSSPGSFEPLKWAPVLLSSAIGALGAAGVYAVLDRLLANPTRAFNVLAAVVLGLAFALVFASAVALPNATVLSLSFVGVTHTGRRGGPFPTPFYPWGETEVPACRPGTAPAGHPRRR
jgi:hypothetical protein